MSVISFFLFNASALHCANLRWHIVLIAWIHFSIIVRVKYSNVTFDCIWYPMLGWGDNVSDICISRFCVRCLAALVLLLALWEEVFLSENWLSQGHLFYTVPFLSFHNSLSRSSFAPVTLTSKLSTWALKAKSCLHWMAPFATSWII